MGQTSPELKTVYIRNVNVREEKLNTESDVSESEPAER